MKLEMYVRHLSEGLHKQRLNSNSVIFFFVPHLISDGNCVSNQATIFPYNLTMFLASKFLKVGSDKYSEQSKTYQKVYRKESPKNFYRRMKFSLDHKDEN